jgi:hypothetical protein
MDAERVQRALDGLLHARLLRRTADDQGRDCT